MYPNDSNPTSPAISPDYDYRSFYKEFMMKMDPVKKISITLYSIIFVLGTIGNGLVIWIAGFRMKRTVSAVWFLNLAIADFLCCASLPLRILEWVEDFSFLHYDFCYTGIILFYLNMTASVLLLVTMSIDRYVSVINPFWVKVHRTRKRLRLIAAIIWVLSFLLTGLVFFLFPYFFIEFHNTSELCYILHYRYFFFAADPIQLLRLVIMFLIPFLIILISYVTIFFKIRKGKRPRRSQRPYRIITAVIVCFFICWCPYYIWPLIPKYRLNTIVFGTVHVIIITLAALNSCINPIIYVFMGQDFTHGFLRSIPFRVQGALSEHPNDLCREGEDIQHTSNTAV